MLSELKTLLRSNYPLIAAAAAGIAVAAGIYAYSSRYEYRVIEFAPGSLLKTRRDTWTGAVCITNSNAWQHVPPGLKSCDADE